MAGPRDRWETAGHPWSTNVPEPGRPLMNARRISGLRDPDLESSNRDADGVLFRLNEGTVCVTKDDTAAGDPGTRGRGPWESPDRRREYLARFDVRGLGDHA